MDFPILDLMDQDGCYHKLPDLLHPDGLVCPHCAARDGLNVHRHRPESAVVGYRCNGCCRVFNLFTGTPWQGTHLSPSQILLTLRGIAQGGAHRETRPCQKVTATKLTKLGYLDKKP